MKFQMSLSLRTTRELTSFDCQLSTQTKLMPCKFTTTIARIENYANQMDWRINLLVRSSPLQTMSTISI